jgi:hypothetical protein
VSEPPALSAADRAELQQAAVLHRPLQRAANLGRRNGAGYVVFGGLSLLFAGLDFDPVGLLLGATLLGIGGFERAQALRLRSAEPTAPRQLARGELALLVAIVGYGVWGLLLRPASGEDLVRMLGGGKGLGIDVRKLADSIATTWYWAVIGITVLYQGGMARHFLARRADVESYRRQAPAWARQLVETMAAGVVAARPAR